MHDAQRHMNYGAVFYFGTYKYMMASGLLKSTVDVLPKLSMGQCHHDNGKSYGRPAHATRPGGAGLRCRARLGSIIYESQPGPLERFATSSILPASSDFECTSSFA